MLEVKLSTTAAIAFGKLAAEAAAFASADQMRPILTGVLIDRDDFGKLRMVATDSYALVAMTTTVDAPEGLAVLVDGKELAAIGKQLAKLTPLSSYAAESDAPAVVLAFGDAALVADASTWSAQARTIQGDFPNWHQLVPTGDQVAETAAFGAAYLAKLAKVTLAATGKVRPPLRVSLFGALKPCRVEASSDYADLLALLMPVRT